jgi:hypothetical protein
LCFRWIIKRLGVVTQDVRPAPGEEWSRFSYLCSFLVDKLSSQLLMVTRNSEAVSDLNWTGLYTSFRPFSLAVRVQVSAPKWSYSCIRN